MSAYGKLEPTYFTSEDSMSSKLHNIAKAIQNNSFQAYGWVPYGPIVTHWIEDVTSIIWYREDDIQVQLFAVPPDYIIPEHTHPNVDSYELLVGGDIKFSKDGKWVTDNDIIEAKAVPPPQVHPYRGSLVRVHPDTPHGGSFGPRGGVFMSIQQWLNGTEPHCVSADYEGVVMGDRHLDGVVSGNAKSKGSQKKLTWRDAASKETSAPTFEG